jgi:PrtD family type I secretion system ABC transporter
MRALLVERLRPFGRTAYVATGVNLALLFPAIFLVQLFDRAPGGGPQTPAFLVALALLVVLLAYAADHVRGRALAAARKAFDRDLIPAAIANSLDTLRDVALLRSFLAGPGMLAVLDIPWLVLYLLAIAWLQPLLGFGTLTGLVLLTLVLAIAAQLRRIESNDSLVHGARAASDQAEELVRAAETLVAMGMSRSAIDAWRARHEPFVSKLQHAEDVAAKLGAIARSGSLALQIGMLVLGAWLVIESRLSVAAMIAAALLLGRGLQSFELLIGHWPAMTAARGAWLRLSRRPTSILVTRAGAPASTSRVELERVSYVPSAGRPASVRNVSLSLALGESILIAGPSGSGKTTLARLMLGVLRPHSGRVSADASVGYLSQEVRLFPGTIADNIARMAPFDSTRVVQAARLAHVHEMIVRLPDGYHTEVCEAGACLSAGRRRRIALARALYMNPRLVVLDDPTADLDADGELALVKTLAALKERGTTVVIVGQGTLVLEHVDRFAILRDGMLQTFEHPVGFPGAAMPLPLGQRPAPQPL